MFLSSFNLSNIADIKIGQFLTLDYSFQTISHSDHADSATEFLVSFLLFKCVLIIKITHKVEMFAVNEKIL